MRSPTVELSTTGQAQLELLLYGIRAPELGTVRDELDLVLPGALWVHTAVRDGAALTLRRAGATWALHGEPGAAPVPVRLCAPHAFAAHQVSTGRRIEAFAFLFERYLVLPAAAPHAYWRTLTARLVGGNGAAEPPHLPYTLDEALEAIEFGFREGLMDYVHVETPANSAADGGWAAVVPLVESIKGHFDTLVSASGYAPATDAWLDAAYAAGVDALSLGLGCGDPDAFAAHANPALRACPQERVWAALAHAARIMPAGAVGADLVLGAETPAQTCAAVDALVAQRALPLLLLPAPTTAHALTDADVFDAWSHAAHRVGGSALKGQWIRHLHAAAFALDGPLLPLRRERHFGMSLAKLRRALRVQTINESYESSGL